MLNMYRWMWKHRYAWKNLKQLWDNRTELRQFLREIDAALNDGTAAPVTLKRLSEQAKRHHEWLWELDRLPCVVPTRPIPRRKNRPMLKRGTELPSPAPGVTYPFLDNDGKLKAGLIPPTPSLPNMIENTFIRRTEPWPDPPPSKRPVDSAYLKMKEAEYWTARIKAFNRGEI